jgi:hypothetical protein
MLQIGRQILQSRGVLAGDGEAVWVNDGEENSNVACCCDKAGSAGTIETRLWL